MDPFWSNLFRPRASAEEALYEVLAGVPIFQDVSRRQFRRIRTILHQRSYRAGEAIVREGDEGLGMYVILDGSVHIVQRTAAGEEQRLAVLAAGDFFGEQALLDSSPRSASAMAAVDSELIGFFRPDLLGLIESNPRLGLKIVMRLSQIISMRLRQTNRLLKEARLQSRRTDGERGDGEVRDDAGGGAPA